MMMQKDERRMEFNEKLFQMRRVWRGHRTMHSANSKMLKLIKILILWLKSMDVWFGPHATTASPAFFTPQMKGLLVRVVKSKPPSHGRSSGQICEALYETYLGEEG